MALEIIGAGFGRTGTLSLKRALEILGYGPCYHMEEIIMSPARADQWVAVGRGKPQWDDIFEGYRATVDWPAATWWRELADHWPNAKVILSVRDADQWFDSTQRTIFNSGTLGAAMPPAMQELIETSVLRLFDGKITCRETCLSVYNSHIDAVQKAISSDRLLVYPVGAGWEPLCNFLGCPVPDQPYPRSNDEAEFKKVAARLNEMG